MCLVQFYGLEYAQVSAKDVEPSPSTQAAATTITTTIPELFRVLISKLHSEEIEAESESTVAGRKILSQIDNDASFLVCDEDGDGDGVDVEVNF